MNGIFFTQSSNVDMFYRVMKRMKEVVCLEKTAFYVTDARYYYETFLPENPSFESDTHCVKEWDIVGASKKKKCNLELLQKYEREIGDPFLWDVVVADRRLYRGARYAHDQDYKTRFSHERLLSILQYAIESIENMFDIVKPDFIISFQCLTMGDFIGYLLAKKRGIRILNMRPTRIENYFFAGESIYEPSDIIRERYHELVQNMDENEFVQKAKKYLEEVRKTYSYYEGVVPPSDKPPSTKVSRHETFHDVLKRIFYVIKTEWKYKFGLYRNDNHCASYISALYGKRIRNRLRAAYVNKRFKFAYLKKSDLEKMYYAFFPLHTEPEVTLSVYSKAYLNQIEVVRTISNALPVGMKLVVKEHPCSIGKRSVNYYKKLCEIPNVCLAHPSLKATDIIASSKLVTVIAGSVGFEGMLMKKPVITLGGAPYNFVSNTMVRHVRDILRLNNEIFDLMQNYTYDEKAIIAFVAAVIEHSVPVDFYARLLRRNDAHNAQKNDKKDVVEEIREEHIRKLALYICEHIASGV